jgi:hypothetical protein
MQGTEQDDELSFQDFKNQIRQLRKFLQGLLLVAGRSIKRYYLLLILLLAGVAALGYYQYKNSRVFEARTSYVYIELQKKMYGEMIDKLQEMILSGSRQRLAEALHLSPEQANSIVALRAENIYGAKLSEDVTEEKKLFYINVMATNDKVFDTLQYALENYLNNNILVKETLSRKRKIMEQKVAYLESALSMLDSLKMAYTKSLDKPSAGMYAANNQFNPVQLYEKGEKMNQELADMKTLLDDYRAVQTQDKFLVTEEPQQKALSFAIKYTGLYLIAAIVLVFILSMFKK